MNRRPVIVGVDGVRDRLTTVDLAAAEAGRRGTRLCILHVWPGRYAGPFRTRGARPTEADARHLLDIAVQRARRAAPDLEISTRLLDGSASEILVQLSAEAELVVVGHRDDVLTRHGWGSTAAYLAHHTACPLLVDRGEHRTTGPVVLAVSAQAPRSTTMTAAFEQARLRRTSLVAVHIWSADNDTGRPAPADYAAARDAADRRLAHALQPSLQAFPDVEVSRLVLHDLDVAYSLNRASRRGQLLVTGTGRHGRVAELLYGSLDLAMLRSTACPVLLIPPSGPVATAVSAQGHPATGRP